MNTAMTTALGSAPSDSAMVHAIGHKILLFRKSKAGLIFLRCRSNHIQIIQI